MSKIIIWDIETTDLKADTYKGKLLCLGWKVYGQKKVQCPTVMDFSENWFTQKDGFNDKALLKHAVEVLSDADLWVTQNGRGFDEKFLNTRLIINDLAPLPQIPTVDTYHNIMRNNVLITSRRLGNAAISLGLRDEKDIMLWETWEQARRGYVPAIRALAKYCKKDVVVTEELYTKTRPLCRTHPNLSLLDGRGSCPICGADKLVKRGISARKVGTSQRYNCKNCGGWSSAPISMATGNEGRIR